MSPRSLLAAAASVGVAGLALGAGLLPAQAADTTTSAPSVHVIAPCEGGVGTATLTVRKTDTGTAAHTTVSGVTHTSWTGAVVIKNPPTQESKYAAPDGSFTASATSTAPWPERAAAVFFSGDDSTLCIAAEVFNLTRAEADSAQTTLVVRRDTKIVKVSGQDLPAGTWTVVARVTTPAGFQKKTKTVTVTKTGKTAGTYATSFTGFKKVGVFTRAAVTATTRDGKHTTFLTLSRTA